jgi:hypothetical protein
LLETAVVPELMLVFVSPFELEFAELVCSDEVVYALIATRLPCGLVVEAAQRADGGRAPCGCFCADGGGVTIDRRVTGPLENRGPG